MGEPLMNLLADKRVDLVLSGHDHNYQRSHQIATNPLTCATVPRSVFDPDCVVDSGGDGTYAKGAGTVFVVSGDFGRGWYPIDPADPEAPYFAATDMTTYGFVRYTVTSESIQARFVNSLGSFTDAFAIYAGPPPPPDEAAPYPPSGLTATPWGPTRIDLAWTAATDDVGVTGYAVWRDGVQVGTTTGTSYADTSVSPGTAYVYSVTARDAAGNISAPSNEASAATPAGSLELRFGLDADAIIKAGSPSSNYGAVTIVGVDASPVEQGLLRFTVSGVGSAAIQSVKLRLYNVNSSEFGGAVYYVLDDLWQEATVTWDTAPAPEATPVATLGAVSAGSWYEIDLTALVTADGTYSLRMSSTASNGADYTSKDGTAGFRPEVVVTLQPT
jgi:chitodextrinase